MFGYVRAREDLLPPERRADYEAAYCGLCRALGQRHGQFARLFLNYDFAFLAMLLAPAGACAGGRCRRCLPHPVHGKPGCTEGEWLDRAADQSVILTWWKLRDAVADEGFFKSLAARFLSLCLGPAYRRAKAACPGFDRQARDDLAQLSALEREKSPSIDRTADRFACILAAAAPEEGDSGRDRTLYQLLYHLGRWIYLIDAVDDLDEDRAAGRYNPVAARFPGWTDEDRAYLRRNMDHSLELAGAAYQLLEPNAWSPVLENILYSGLPSVEELVFSGRWRDYLKRHRRNDT